MAFLSNWISIRRLKLVAMVQVTSSFSSILRAGLDTFQWCLCCLSQSVPELLWTLLLWINELELSYFPSQALVNKIKSVTSTTDGSKNDASGSFSTVITVIFLQRWCVTTASSWICGRIFWIILATLLCFRGLKAQGDTGVFVSLFLDHSKARILWIPPRPPHTHTSSFLALTSSLFVLLSSPQLCHNIQRAGAHNSGCKHTRGSKVVQQQPRTRDAYELARLWGMTGNLPRRAREGCSSWLLMAPFALSLSLQEYNPDQASAPPKKKKPDGAPPTPSTDHVAPPGDRSRSVRWIH